MKRSAAKRLQKGKSTKLFMLPPCWNSAKWKLHEQDFDKMPAWPLCRAEERPGCDEMHSICSARRECGIPVATSKC